MSTTTQRKTAIEAIQDANAAADPATEDVAKARTAVYAEIEAELVAGAPWPSDAGARVLAAEQAAQEAIAARNARHDIRARLRRSTPFA